MVNAVSTAATLYAPLPNVQSAKLPATYEAAKVALSECSRVDECQKWANQAEALASYARQSGDQSMRKMADRIQARAIRRCGELLKQINRGNGANQNIRDGSAPKVTRKSAATDAGLSERQRKTALRVASVDGKEFETAIESDNPPTVTKLAQRGKLIDLGKASPAQFSSATKALAQISRFAEFAATNDPAEVAAGVTKLEIKKARADVATIDAWLDKFITSI